MESINNQLLYIAICVTVRFLATNAFLLIHGKVLGSCRSENLIPQASQSFLRSSDTDFAESDTNFVETKAFLSADIPLYKLNNTHIKNLFRDIGHRLPSETTCRRTALQLSEDELKRIRMLFMTNKFFLLLMRALCLARNT